MTRDVARQFWASQCTFWRCPTTGRIIEATIGDDKALCSCRRSNPLVPTEETERTGTHVVRFLKSATVDEWLSQLESNS